VTANRVVTVASIGALVVGVILVGAAILVAGGDEPVATTGDELACVEGDLATNPINQFGRVEERIEDFSSLEEAESFICHRIRYPRETGNLRIERIRAKRSLSLVATLEGAGDAYVLIDYIGADADHYILARIASLPFTDLTRSTRDEPLLVQGVEGFLRHGGRTGNVVAVWQKDDLYFSITSQLHDDFTMDDFLAILESIR